MDYIEDSVKKAQDYADKILTAIGPVKACDQYIVAFSLGAVLDAVTAGMNDGQKKLLAILKYLTGVQVNTLRLDPESMKRFAEFDKRGE